MNLPPPEGNKVFWKNYEIATPTFQLMPVEKPDMSPFLVHMTGKNEIISILKGHKEPNKIDEGCGFLKASVPENSQNYYKAEVVCFTESPTFALDFFRYRSFERWQSDKRFGLGFDKTNLVNAGVRPVVYAEESLVKNIIHLYELIQQSHKILSDDDNLNERLVDLITKTYALLFPLLENQNKQGYMWEREWRATKPGGFSFSYRDIKIICCPQEEEQDIRDILGTLANNIQFIRAWREYDDVTEFLKRQQQVWQTHDEIVQKVTEKDKKIQPIRDLIQQYQIDKNSLASYQEFITSLNSNKQKVDQELETITQKKTELEKQLVELEMEKKEDPKKKMLPDFSGQRSDNNNIAT